MVLDEWIKDSETATNRITKSARKIVDCIEQVAYEGRRVDSHDMSCLVQPRNELLLHVEIAMRAGRELCRWASSIQQQRDQVLTNYLTQTQTREATLAAEVQRLIEKLDRMEVDLELTQRQLNEQQNESQKKNTIHESVESLKGHLQRQLRQRESECSRLVLCH
ncbi:Outer dense fiber of sperm tails 2 [Schistosoma japonicum]|uniref:Outer dense fiber of sperm tails 2 n=1 Tax=Schistosoma japonicum TaxID=6182 RepID=A0A4Z2DIJ2_SCHJA|nr:Outer dense fiber of sperm tails 2 [Schistosoma japonicum]